MLVVNVNVNREFDNEKGNEKDNYNESSFNIGNNYANKDNCIGRDDHTVCANYISKHKDTIKNGNGSDVR